MRDKETPASNAVRVQLPPLLQWQKTLRDHTARYKVAACARQVGKTFSAVLFAGKAASEGKKGWWIAPDYSLTEPGYDLMEELFTPLPGVEVQKKRHMFRFPGGGYIQVKSADDPQKLRGATLDFVIMDEAAFMPPEAWYDGASHTLSVKRGWAIFLSSPFGKNWFYELFLLGQDPARKEWASFTVTQYENPYIEREEIESKKQMMPARKFDREVLARFVDAGGEVFPYIRKIATLPEIQVAEEGHRYVSGIDWGSRLDYTVIVVWDATTGQQVARYRFAGDNFQQQYEAVENIYKMWRFEQCIAEENNIGQVHVQELMRRGLPIEPFNTNRFSKRDLIEDYAAAQESAAREKRPMLIASVNAITEHEAYESSVTANGTLLFYAPRGFHDDEVIANALAWRGVRKERGLGTASLSYMHYTGLYRDDQNRQKIRKRDYSKLWRK